MEPRPFRKMHGLGNDFVVIDARGEPFRPAPREAAAIADRRRGVGCDQLIILEPVETSGADVFMRIFNADGSEAEACGNATRCVASLLFAESGLERAVVRTLAGDLLCLSAGEGQVTTDMGAPRLEWQEIPLARPMDTLSLEFHLPPLPRPVAVSIGNPHVVFFVENLEELPLEELGPRIERDPLFPRRTNVQLVEPLARDRLRQRIWERGAGLTLASGSSACAALAAAVRRDLADRRATIEQPGGSLAVEWREDDGHLLMTGPVATAFSGRLHPSLGCG